MNKVFEVIEAKNIFNIPYSKIKILIHPKSYVHALVKFKNGITKLLIHDTSMKIPIYNALNYYNEKEILKSKNLDFDKLNNLNFSSPDLNKFYSLKILNLLPRKKSLFETILITANDEIVRLFLKKKIRFNQIVPLINKIIKDKDFAKYKKIPPKNLKNITDLNKFVRLKIKPILYKRSS